MSQESGYESEFRRYQTAAAAQKRVMDYKPLIQAVCQQEFAKSTNPAIRFSDIVVLGALAVRIALVNQHQKAVNANYLAQIMRTIIHHELTHRYGWV